MNELRPGADVAMGEIGGTPLVRHHGEPESEYRAAREAAGVVERGDLRAFRLWGRDPARMLNGLITNALPPAEPGRGVYAAMLTPKGRMIADLRAFPVTRADGAEVAVLAPAIAATAVGEQLRKFIPPLYARWEDLGGRLAVLGLYGPASADLLERVLGSRPPPAEDDFLEIEHGGEAMLVVATRMTGEAGGYDILLPAGALQGVRGELLDRGAELGVQAIGFAALETLRIEAGRPRYGVDMTEETLPAEAYESTAQMERAVSFKKGCYTGQEVVVRIAHRGHVNRHLRGLLLGEAPSPPFRSALWGMESGREVGWTTSAAHSPRLGQTVALGYLRREVGAGEHVRVGSPDGAEALVAELPFPVT